MKLVVFSTLLVGWMAYYFCQRTLPSAMTTMISTDKHDSTASDGITRAYISQLQSVFAVADSISFFISGILSDVVNVKVIFFTGLALSGTLLSLFPLTEGNRALGILVYVFFGLCQGCGWPSATGVLRQTYNPSELSLVYGVVSTGSSIATILSPFLVLSISSASSWEYSFFITGMAAIFTAILVLAIIGVNGTKSGVEAKVSEYNSTGWLDMWIVQILCAVVVTNSILWLLKASILDWGQLYLIQSQGLTQDMAGKTVGILQIGGILGKLASGFIASKAMRMKRIGSIATSGKTCVAVVLLLDLLCLSMVLTVFSTATLRLNPILLLILELFLIGLLLEGALIIVALMVINTVPKFQSGKVLAVTQSSSLLVGRFLAGWPFNKLVEWTGWNQAFLVVSLLCFVATAISGYLGTTFHTQHLKQKKLK